MFQLTKEELENWKSQIVTSNSDKMGLRKMPYVFTEQGVSMLSAILKSDTAVGISVKIIREFVNMRKLISQNEFIFQKFENIEKRQLSYELNSNENFNKIFKALDGNNPMQSQGIFCNGQIFDAHNFVSDLIRSAKNSIVIIDNYIDDTTLTLCSKNKSVDITIYTQTISKELKLDLDKYNRQYKKISLKITKDFHDRFLIIDEKEVYHIGASLKDLGKKVFAFSKIEDFNKISSIHSINSKCFER